MLSYARVAACMPVEVLPCLPNDIFAPPRCAVQARDRQCIRRAEDVGFNRLGKLVKLLAVVRHGIFVYPDHEVRYSKRAGHIRSTCTTFRRRLRFGDTGSGCRSWLSWSRDEMSSMSIRSTDGCKSVAGLSKLAKSVTAGLKDGEEYVGIPGTLVLILRSLRFGLGVGVAGVIGLAAEENFGCLSEFASSSKGVDLFVLLGVVGYDIVMDGFVNVDC